MIVKQLELKMYQFGLWKKSAGGEAKYRNLKIFLRIVAFDLFSVFICKLNCMRRIVIVNKQSK